jgi:hypothetical protein
MEHPSSSQPAAQLCSHIEHPRRSPGFRSFANFSMCLSRSSLARRRPLAATSTLSPISNILSQPIERPFCLLRRCAGSIQPCTVALADSLPLPCIHAYRLKMLHTPSLAKELLSRRLANTHTHNQTQSNKARSVTSSPAILALKMAALRSFQRL